MSTLDLAAVAPRRAVAARIPFPEWFLRDVAAPFLLTRAALASVGLLTAALVPRFNGTDNAALTTQPWLSLWSVWDSRWYLSIARDGYSYLAGQQSNAAFAPGLPMLMRGVAQALGRTDDDAYLFAGFLISNVALLVALGYLVALVRMNFDGLTTGRAALYMLVFPSSFFLSAVYPQSLFLACAIASFYYARKGRWWLAGALGCAAGLTRLQASAIILPLAYEYLRQRGFSVRSLQRRHVCALAIVPLGFLAFVAYIAILSGEPLAALKAGAAWHRQLTWPWEVLAPFASNPFVDHGFRGNVSDLVYTLLLLGLAAYSWRRLPSSLALFATTFSLLIVSSGTLFSSLRYTLEVFPVFIILAILGRRPLFHRVYLGLAALNALRLMSLFALGDWIA